VTSTDTCFETTLCTVVHHALLETRKRFLNFALEWWQLFALLQTLIHLLKGFFLFAQLILAIRWSRSLVIELPNPWHFEQVEIVLAVCHLACILLFWLKPVCSLSHPWERGTQPMYQLLFVISFTLI
jgi:hypothetical protein